MSPAELEVMSDLVPPEDKTKAFEDRKKILRGVRRRRDELLATKRLLAKDVLAIEKELNWRPKDHDDNDKKAKRSILTLCDIQGFSLSQHSKSMLNDGEIVYSACCEDDFNPFKILVTVKESQVSKLELHLAAHSGLHEIRDILQTCCEESNPSFILSTISAFFHLNNFRNKVLVEKLTALKRYTFNVFPPTFGKENSSPSYKITALGGTVEIRWTMVWDKVYHCLVHDFSIPTLQNVTSNKNLQKMWDQLLQQTFTLRNERILWDWWTEFTNMIASV